MNPGDSKTNGNNHIANAYKLNVLCAYTPKKHAVGEDNLIFKKKMSTFIRETEHELDSDR